MVPRLRGRGPAPDSRGELESPSRVDFSEGDRVTKRLSIVALLSFVAAAWALPGAPHELTLKGNKKVSCEIVKEGPKEVTYKDEKGKQQTVPNDQVSKIDYKEDFPGDLGA